MKTANEIFRMEFGNARNFMTPTLLERNKINDYFAYELSTGTGIANGQIWGLTVVFYNPKTDKTQRTYGESQCHHSIDSASDHLLNLIETKPFRLILEHARTMKKLGSSLV